MFFYQEIGSMSLKTHSGILIYIDFGSMSLNIERCRCDFFVDILIKIDVFEPHSGDFYFTKKSVRCTSKAHSDIRFLPRNRTYGATIKKDPRL